MQARSVVIVSAAQIVAVGFLLWFLFRMPRPWDLQRETGTAMMILGILGIITARVQLGRSFAIRAEAHQLVTHGVYSKIRNPIYVFGIVLFAGFVLVFHRPMLWLLVLALAILQIVRARREARVLEATFGDAYREYRSKTWF